VQLALLTAHDYTAADAAAAAAADAGTMTMMLTPVNVGLNDRRRAVSDVERGLESFVLRPSARVSQRRGVSDDDSGWPLHRPSGRH